MEDGTKRLDGTTKRLGGTPTGRLESASSSSAGLLPELGLRPGGVIDGRYKVLQGLEHGGEADVYLCQDPLNSDAEVVVKLYRSKIAPDVDVITKLKGLKHPDILCVLSFGEFAGRKYEVSEY